MSEERNPHAHHAQVGELHLETWEANGRYFWSVTNIKTRQQLNAGEAKTLDMAKIQASGAAGVQREQWRNLRPSTRNGVEVGLIKRLADAVRYVG